MNIKISNQDLTTNAAVCAMQILQNSMKGEREKSGLLTDDDINALIKEIRNEVENP